MNQKAIVWRCFRNKWLQSEMNWEQNTDAIGVLLLLLLFRSLAAAIKKVDGNTSLCVMLVKGINSLWVAVLWETRKKIGGDWN